MEMSSRRARKAPEEVALELPSSESEFDEDFNSGDEMVVDDDGSDEGSDEGSAKHKEKKQDKHKQKKKR